MLNNAKLELDPTLTISENIASLLLEITNNSELHALEQTISHRELRNELSTLQAKLLLETCKEYRKTQEHYYRR